MFGPLYLRTRARRGLPQTRPTGNSAPAHTGVSQVPGQRPTPLLDKSTTDKSSVSEPDIPIPVSAQEAIAATTILPPHTPARLPIWAYGVTTVPSRQKDLLPRTLASLKLAGFDKPRLFIDGAKNDYWYRDQGWEYETTCRYPAVRTHGNWILSMYELYIRRPDATRYAIFQDDFVTYPNLRQYLEHCTYPTKGYLNLYTFPSNQILAPKSNGWYPSNQYGRGAVALIMDRDTVLTLLSQRSMVERPMDLNRGWRRVDGGIVDALKGAGWKEYVHNPSLVQHTGDISAMGNKPHLKAISFMGENFDAMSLIEKKK